MAIFAVLFPQTLYSQAGQKWPVEGIEAEEGYFVGTTNDVPLVLKSNNVIGLTLLPDGTVRVEKALNVGTVLRFDSLSGSGFVLVAAGNDGVLNKIIMPNDSDYVLTGNGTFRKNNWDPGFGDTIRTKVIIGETVNATSQLLIDGSVTIGSRGTGDIGEYSVVIGGPEPMFGFPEAPVASGKYSVALGTGGEASNIGSIMLGGGNISSGTLSLALGAQNTSSADMSVAIGNNNTAAGNQSVAIGERNQSLGKGSYTYGLDNISTGERSLAIGNGTLAEGETSMALGFLTKATGTRSWAAGSGATNGTDTAWLSTSGRNAFNFSSISKDYTGTGVAADYSAILGGNNNSIEPSARYSIVLGGKDIIATE
ncbi:MAG: hypothetical protein KKA07_05755, partial [Bacteroidetes bacterium]|nr:hypothetical protein [Bacteroidota bacterium]MBU1718559.1 hypothetical protein [Bacteroidota bacterium]